MERGEYMKRLDALRCNSLLPPPHTPHPLILLLNYKQSNCKDLNGHLNYHIKV